MDLYDQKEGLDKNGQFRFTPPTHTMLAFRRALEEFNEQGGLRGRRDRYDKKNQLISNDPDID